MSDRDPKGWSATTLEQLVEAAAPIIYGILQPGPEVQVGVPYVRPTEIRNDAIQLDEVRRTSVEIAAKYARSTLRQGDVLLSIVGTIGKVAIVPAALNGANITQSSVRIRPGPAIDSVFLKAMLKAPSLTSQYEKHRLGTGVPRLNVAHVRELRCVLPPLNEQRRIVAKLEALQARSRRAREALDAVPPLLETLRQSILADACEGRGAQGVSSARDLPAGWRLAALDELVVPGGIFDGARDHGAQTAEAQNLRASDYTTSGVRVIRLENLDYLRFVTDKQTFISEAKYEGLKVSTVREGDVLFGSFVEDSVRVCLLPRLDTLAVAKADCFCIRVDTKKVLAEYLMLQLASRRTYRLLREVVRGATRPRITTKHLKNLVVPVCPIREQAQIVASVRRRLAFAESIGRLVRESQHKLETLQQAVLAKAFRGGLVSPDPNDEPTEVMLARVRGANGDAANGARSKRGKKSAGARRGMATDE